MLKNSSKSYGTLTKFIHWSIFILLSVQFYLVLAPNLFENFSPVFVHKSLGVLLLILGLSFILWRLRNVKPDLPKEFVWKKRLAIAMHHTLLTLLVLIPLLGYCMSCTAGKPIQFFGLFNVPCFLAKDSTLNDLFFQCHQKLGLLFLGLIILHSLAAFYHHFILKDNILKRILPGHSDCNTR